MAINRIGKVETTGEYSLHLSFDICDHNIGANVALDLLLKEFRARPTHPYTPVKDLVEELTRHAQLPAFRQRLQDLQAEWLARDKGTRAMAVGNRVTYLEQLTADDAQSVKP